MRVYLGADHQGFFLKNKVRDYLTKAGYQITDYSNKKLDPDDDFPKYAKLAAKRVVDEKDDTDVAILVCGGGQGMCMAANRIKGVRAIVASSVEDATYGRNDNDANILCLPARVLEEGLPRRQQLLGLQVARVGAGHHLDGRAQPLQHVTGRVGQEVLVEAHGRQEQFGAGLVEPGVEPRGALLTGLPRPRPLGVRGPVRITVRGHPRAQLGRLPGRPQAPFFESRRFPRQYDIISGCGLNHSPFNRYCSNCWCKDFSKLVSPGIVASNSS